VAGRQTRASADKKTCDQCFFRARNLCALGLDEPCPTFRPDSPAGLMPPRQPILLARGVDPSGHQAALSQAAA
jgi:hypothetical protein